MLLDGQMYRWLNTMNPLHYIDRTRRNREFIVKSRYMKLSELLQKGAEELKSTSQTALLDSEVLLAFILKKDKSYLYTHDNEDISQEECNKFHKFISRRKKGEPIAYIVGKKEFYGLTFTVDKNVLIPRPETEELVDLAFSHITTLLKGSIKKKIKIVDVGTGSGNIAVALMQKIVESRLNEETLFIFYLTDISGKALKEAEKNWKKLIGRRKGIKVYFLKKDLLKSFNGRMDIIISNPPYIPKEKLEYLDPTVRNFEPKVALDGGEGGLEVVKQLITQSLQYTKDKKLSLLDRDGVLLFEIHERHPNKIKFLLKENFPEWKVRFKRDSFGEWRFAIISRSFDRLRINSQTVNSP